MTGKVFTSKRFSVDMVGDYAFVRPGDSVVILPNASSIFWFLIKQNRPAIDRVIFEAPAGRIDDGELPHEAAARELAEETGYAAKCLNAHGFIYTSPGYTDEKVYIFTATELYRPAVKPKQDEGENIELITLSASVIKKMCNDGTISDAKTICAVYRCLT